MAVRFAAWGVDHIHVFDHIEGLVAAGAEFAGYAPESTAPGIVRGLEKLYPDAPKLSATSTSRRRSSPSKAAVRKRRPTRPTKSRPTSCNSRSSQRP